MIRTLCLALSASLLLAACGSKTETDTRPATSDLKDTSSLPDPFETLFPWNPDRDDIITTDSGLQYIVTHSGDPDGPKPGINDNISVHYDGRLAADGTPFDSSLARGEPAEYGVSQVIPGWTEALQLMVPGDEFMVYLPSNIAYGERGTPGGPIPPNADLMFRVNLIETLPDETPGAEFFDENTPWDSTAANVNTTASGLEYIVLASGDEAGTKPTEDQVVRQHFELRKASDNRRLDSSFANAGPQKFPVGSLIPGWSQALQEMRPGDDWLVYLPSSLAFGERGTQGGPIGPNEDLILRLNLLEIVVPQVSDSAAWEKYTPWNSDAPEVQKTESGLEYIVLEAGDADGETPDRRSRVEVYYEGRLTTGETFDSAYARGESIEFGVTQVIPGWTEALQLMVPGDRWLVYIPSEIGYGQTPRPGGLIKPGDDLVFEMQLIGFK